MISTQFLNRAIKNKHERTVSTGWAMIFAGMGVMSLLLIVYDYFLPGDLQLILFDTFTIIGNSALIIAVFMFEFLYKRFKDTRYLVTILGIITTIFVLTTTDLLKSLLVVAYFLLLLVFTLIFFTKLVKLSTGRVRRLVVLFIIAFYTLMVGNFLSGNPNSQISQNLGLDNLFVASSGRLIRITGIVVIKYVLGELPIFMEVNWQEQLVNVMVIHKKMGVLLKGHSFQDEVEVQERENEQMVSDELKAGGFVGITTLLQEIAQSERPLNIIDHGDMKIMLEHGEDVLMVLYVKEEMQVYRELLVRLRERFEHLFQGVLAAWEGNLNIFDPVTALITEIFQPEKN
ncbi:MAG: hypothetical protein ACFFCS_13280 [Candidatus Hodarchaeota archaeon]